MWTPPTGENQNHISNQHTDVTSPVMRLIDIRLNLFWHNSIGNHRLLIVNLQYACLIRWHAVKSCDINSWLYLQPMLVFQTKCKTPKTNKFQSETIMKCCNLTNWSNSMPSSDYKIINDVWKNCYFSLALSRFCMYWLRKRFPVDPFFPLHVCIAT